MISGRLNVARDAFSPTELPLEISLASAVVSSSVPRECVSFAEWPRTRMGLACSPMPQNPLKCVPEHPLLRSWQWAVS